MLDDFLIIGSSPDDVSAQPRRFLDFCEECGIPIAPEKTEGPDQKLAFFGYNTRRHTVPCHVAGG